MPLRRVTTKPQREPTIALINIVFLMLIFFLIAGNLAPPLGPVDLIDTADLDGRAPPDAAVILPDGTLLYRGVETTPESFADTGDNLRLVPDRALPAGQLLAIVSALQGAGAAGVWIVTERGLNR
ncbi:biopolymer transporter ExbD [Rhodophyticola sp. CCM32]|uniref:ExbD/TolR family protein n=1 Tax=Rhodophyticola sp. CCM32 TaxID=2916397 RepID=UPI00107F3B02|nr:biopolymer transporter ExbD [Rhodophyticola sp. CCM32]QBY01484.1 biopolymer transporter ExbD [Rhodophyticola sp. CCM32]